MSELKPCPFCGKPGGTNLDDPIRTVGCFNTDCFICPQLDYHVQDRRQAFSYWNIRVGTERPVDD